MAMQKPLLLKPPIVRSGAGVSVIAPASFAQLDRINVGLRPARAGVFSSALHFVARRGPLYLPEQRSSAWPIFVLPLPTKQPAP